MEQIRNAYTLYAGKTEAKTLHEICNCRWEEDSDNTFLALLRSVSSLRKQ
jgi:hypothetical protein